MAADTISERVAHNQNAFREANERIEGVADELNPDIELIPFICECPQQTCTEITKVTRKEYERVRSDGRTFLVAPGHEVCAVDGVQTAVLSEKFDRFSVMRKVDEAGAIAAELDPRGDR